MWEEIGVPSSRSCSARRRRAAAGSVTASTPVSSFARMARGKRRCSCERLVKGAGGRLQGLLDRRLVVGEGDEPGLVLGRGRVDAAVEHRPAEASVGLGVAGGGGGEVD